MPSPAEPVHSRLTRNPFTLEQRAAGVLLHPTSLPGPHGSGEIGPAALEFIDFLAEAGLRWWQMLPLGPPGPGNSPYSAISAFATSAWLVSLTDLVHAGLLNKRDLPRAPAPADRVNFPAATRGKRAALRRAFAEFVRSGGLENPQFAAYCTAQADWLDDFAAYLAIRERLRADDWTRWPAALRRGRKHGLRFPHELQSAFEFQRFVQFVLDGQWQRLRAHARRRGVALLGDIPIFVAHASSDVWAHPELFDLRADGRARTVSGVPPDLFSATGQRWGHPQYRWPAHRRTDFAWWVARFRRARAQFDAVRIDHFLGFCRVWAIPGDAPTAQQGRWVPTPGVELFTTLRRRLGRLEIVAEDLGLLTPAAAALRDRFQFPGMRLLHFAFGGDADSAYHLPHNHVRRSVVFPGTHDNDTTAGWLAVLREKLGREAARRRGPSAYERLQRYAGIRGRVATWDVLRLVCQSPAAVAILPMQDLLGLDNSARMNLPGTTRGNWSWRLPPGRLTPRLAGRIRELLVPFERVPGPDRRR